MPTTGNTERIRIAMWAQGVAYGTKAILWIRGLIWSVMFALVLAIFVSRFFVSYFYDKQHPAVIAAGFLFCFALLFMSFIVEGIVLALSKIEEYDDDATISTMRNRFGASDRLGPTLVYVKQNANYILVGQPIVAITITLMFNAVFDSFGLQSSPSQLPLIIVFLMSSGAVSGVVSAAMIYWIGQLLPQKLGKDSATDFMRLFGSTFGVRFLIALALSGIGLPSKWLEAIIKKLGYFGDSAPIPIGNEKIFNSLSADYGYYADLRTIILEPGETDVTVTDVAEYKYLAKRPAIRHTYRIALGQFDPSSGLDLTLKFPAGIQSERAHTLGQFESQVSKITGSEMEVESVFKERTYVVESSVIDDVEFVRTKAIYKRPPFTTERDKSDSFYFDMGVPTREIKLDIKSQSGALILEPSLEFASEESRFFDKPTILGRGKLATSRNPEGGWFLNHCYPPLSAEMRLTIDARPL